ncbi:hypothetical protein VNO80_11904 [Phaseolus coccineus]|uniref:Uncharacterized protein n=1 Tax=Phaseolus coccineus TaxID=3886 RepID=A0AAN9RKV9_PHACN
MNIRMQVAVYPSHVIEEQVLRVKLEVLKSSSILGRFPSFLACGSVSDLHGPRLGQTPPNSSLHFVYRGRERKEEAIK